MRKFEVVDEKFRQYNQTEFKMPKRATKYSAGYDMYSPIDITIKPGESEMIWTNIKAKFNENEMLMLFVTSKMGKKHIMIANGTGIIESDYYGNVSNDGNLGFRLINLGKEDYEIKVGDKIGQGVFTYFLTVDDEEEITNVRTGGFGSTSTGFSN
ncbi:MAG: dUTP diphosphatase [Firmicutes bacterium]|nr:dUTP diphosphatase [Bacillota bacterium]